MPLVLEQYVKSLLPTYIKEKDSFKDGSGEGFVVRFTAALGEELDDEYYNKIDIITQELDPFTASTLYLDYIGQTLGNLPDFSQDENHYRRILGFIISIYKIKGTRKSFTSIFHAVSLTTVITEIVPAGLIYDESTPNIYDGAGFVFLFMTSATGSITSPQTDKIRHRNNLFVNGKAYGGYIHSPSTLGLEYEWIKNYFIKFNDWYEDILGESAVTAIYAKAGAATDDVSFVDNIKDTTRAAWFNEADSSIDLIDNGANNDALLLPDYQQTGIDYTKYKGIWADSKGDDDSTFIAWAEDDIVTVFTDTVGTRFYKCISAHTSIITSDPVADTGQWTHMTWDEAGIRIDEVGWETTDTQSNLPPDNFALGDDFWNEQGIGLSHSVAPNVWSKFKWYYADDASGTNKVQILYEKEGTIDLTTDGNAWLALKTGKYIVGSVTPVDSLGTTGTETFATGIII